MVRVEIIANHSVEENLLEAFSLEGVGKFYTKYPNVFGIGTSGPRMGDAVWPEENFALIIWCEEDEARGIARAVAAVKKQFPDEGIRIFGIPAEPGRFLHAAEPVWPSAEARPHAEPAPQAAVPAAPVAYGAPPVYTPATSAAPVYSPAAPQAVPVTPAAPAAYGAPPAYTPAVSATPAYSPITPQPAPVTPAAPPAYTAPPPAAPAIPDEGIGKEYDGQNMEN